MPERIDEFDLHEEWRTGALLVTWRASSAGEAGPGGYLLRRLRNPLGVVPPEAYERLCAARLESVAALRDAAEERPELFSRVRASGRCEGGVFDVVDLPALTLADCVDRRVRVEPFALHRLLERVAEACAALQERTGRAHGDLDPAWIFFDALTPAWAGAPTLAAPPAPFPPEDGVAADLRSLGRIMHRLALWRDPDPGVFQEEGDAAPFRRFGRSGARHRRLCAELLGASGEAMGWDEALGALRAIRPASPGKRKAVRFTTAAAAVALVAGGAAAAWIATRPEGEPLGVPPPKRQFDQARDFARILTRTIEQAEGAPLGERLASSEFLSAVRLLSVQSMLTEEEFRQWFRARRQQVERPGADEHSLIRWTISNVDAWQEAYDEALALVHADLIEPLRDASARAREQGWTEPARDAADMADRCERMLESGDLVSLAQTLDAAATIDARVDGWLARLAEARRRAEELLAPVEESGAAAPVAGADGPIPIVEAARRWLDALAQAQPGESPDATIERFANESFVVLSQVGETAEYWATNERFDREQYLAEAAPLDGEAFADAGSGREAFEAWRSGVREARFVNIGPDPRIRLAERRDELRREIEETLAGLTDEEMELIEDRVEPLRARLASVEAAIEDTGEWRLENEQRVLDAVARAGSRLGEAMDQFAAAQSYLAERADIELRRRGAVARAEALRDEHPDWFADRLDPLIASARDAGDDQLEAALNTLTEETQRLRVAARDEQILHDAADALRGDNATWGDALRARANTLLERWKDAVPGSPEDAAAIRGRIDELARLRDEARGFLRTVDARSGPLTPEQAQPALSLSQDLSAEGIDPASSAEQGRLFQIMAQLTPYLERLGRRDALRDRLASDMASRSLRVDVLWHAYELLRDADSEADGAWSLDDIALEQEVRGLLAADQALPERLAQPSISDRLDRWMAQRPAQWETNADALADLASAESLLSRAGVTEVADQPHLLGAALLRDVVSYAPGEEAPDEAVQGRIDALLSRLEALRPAVPGDGAWYPLLSETERRLSELRAGGGGPTLDLDLLATIGPAGAGWTLRADSTIERPAYEREGVAMRFALIESVEEPFYLASDELSLAAFQVIVRQADDALWSAVAEHAVLKDWGAAPDYDALPSEIRGYWVTAQREVFTQEDWITPPAQVREAGVDWSAHRELIYGDDSARSVAWAPTLGTPLHLIGFQGAWATAESAGCRLPTPAEWRAALQESPLREGASPNVSDATWLRQVQRAVRGAPSPESRSFFAYGTRDTPETYDAQDDGWLWPRPVDEAPSAPALRDMIGNVAEWADALAMDRPEAFTIDALTDEEVEAAARIAGVSALSGAGAADQIVTLSRSRRDRRENLLADINRGAGQGFPDVGVRLAFGLGDAAPRTLAERYARTMEGVAGVVGSASEGDAP